MAPRKRAGGGAPRRVEAFEHDDKRANLPTPEAAAEYDYEAGVQQVAYPRDSTLDPQLVWKGKDEQDSADLLADSPAIFVQEKVDPNAIIRDLRRDTVSRRPADDNPGLFPDPADFDGLDAFDRLDFYRHEANWSNRMVLGDSLQVMASLAERESLRGRVQMVYLDPPYGIKFGSNWQVSARKRDVKDGKLEDTAREAEQIKAFRDTWELGIHSYLAYLRDRLTVARDLLTESGSCFVQIGSANLHFIGALMAEVFGQENHVETIAFRKKTMPLGGRLLEGAYDYVVWYAKNKESVKYRRLFQKQTVQGDSHWNVAVDPNGATTAMSSAQIESHALLPPGTDVAQLIGLYPVGPFATGIYDFEYEGKTYQLPPGKSWPSPVDGMQRLAIADRLRPYSNGSTLRYLLRFSDYPVTVYNNVWTDTSAATGMTYVVETSPKVVQRCMLMCTDPGDIVVDPTCGSGTTAFVAEQWGRRWITIDTSRVALALARQRLMGARFPYFLLADSPEGRAKEAELAGAAPVAGTTTGDLHQGFVYERVQHITLKSIANNPDIVEGMTRQQIDAAIKRHADFETLYDKPHVDKTRTRVTGPFTVESLSPHRAVAFSPQTQDPSTVETISEANGAAASPSFEASILDSLRAAGIQTGQKDKRIEFANLDSYAGEYLQAIGERRSDDFDTAPSRVAIAIGPQYGTVAPDFVKAAAREAIAADGVALLAVLAFSFDAHTTEVTEVDGVDVAAGRGEGTDFATVASERRLGRLPVLLVTMNTDLLMGDSLKNTGKGNLFTVFGEPDIDISHTEDGEIVVDLRGVDVYDPTTGALRNNDTSQIALWMIDTDYDGESFFVRHCYFTGGGDPYKRLRNDLKAEIDAEAWSTLYSTTSRPFTRPTSGRIAVKVINDYGDEVMKVFDV